MPVGQEPRCKGICMEAVPVEFEWLCNHPEIEEQYKEGEYIAIVGEAVVAHGTDLDVVLEEAERYGKEPLIHKVTPHDKDILW
jgi:hypothetical protein